MNRFLSDPNCSARKILPLSGRLVWWISLRNIFCACFTLFEFMSVFASKEKFQLRYANIALVKLLKHSKLLNSNFYVFATKKFTGGPPHPKWFRFVWDTVSIFTNLYLEIFRKKVLLISKMLWNLAYNWLTENSRVLFWLKIDRVGYCSEVFSMYQTSFFGVFTLKLYFRFTFSWLKFLKCTILLFNTWYSN